ncbi:MAG: hypothetical protein J0M02_01045 [Planctomycetes bacterium]|nr:hypothetical protein [Planctomycetota bacterium]
MGLATTPAMLTQIEEQWKSRARTQGYKPGSNRYRQAELEFFVGAMAAIEAVTGNPSPPRWVIAGMRGDPIAV